MKVNYKCIAITAAFLILGTLLWHTYSEAKDKTTTITNYQSNVPISKSVNNNDDESNKTVEMTFSADIVIYNSHAGEDYPSGKKVTDAAALLNDKLVEKGLNSRFIKCDPPSEYIKAYQITRDLITQNVKDYSNTILLDIHRDLAKTNKSDTKKILLVLAKENPHYEANKKFANLLLTEFRKSDQVKSDVFEYNKGILYFNEDLSNNSLLIEIGNDLSSNSDIEECINELASALKNIKKSM